MNYARKGKMRLLSLRKMSIELIGFGDGGILPSGSCYVMVYTLSISAPHVYGKRVRLRIRK